MPVLKNQDATAAFKDAIVLDMSDVRKEAARVIADAKAEALRIIETSRQEKERISTAAHDEAFERGQADGMDQGLREGREQGRAEALQQTLAELQQLRDAWVQAVRSLEEQRQQLDRQARQAVLDFALLLGRKLVHRVIEVDDRVIVDQVATALSHVLRPLDVTIRIHPDDRPTLERALPDLVAQIAGLEHVRLIDDPQIGRGGCAVGYAQGQIDATLETQMRRIVELLVPGEPQQDST